MMWANDQIWGALDKRVVVGTYALNVITKCGHGLFSFNDYTVPNKSLKTPLKIQVGKKGADVT